MTRLDIAARAGRTTARTNRRRATGAGVLLALLAVLAQTSLPHLHQWLAGSHGPAEEMRITTGTVAIATDAGAHVETDCDTCRALAQSRVYLAAGAPAPATLVVAAASGDDHAQRTCAPLPVAHAPRSPPLAA